MKDKAPRGYLSGAWMLCKSVKYTVHCLFVKNENYQACTSFGKGNILLTFQSTDYTVPYLIHLTHIFQGIRDTSSDAAKHALLTPTSCAVNTYFVGALG